MREYASQITRKLVEEHDVKMVVVACNTATAAALELLRYDYDVPLVGVIDPGVRALLSVTRSGRVGVIGTVGAIGSGAYQRAVQARRSLTSAGLPVELTCTACPGFVELVEQGRARGEEATELAEQLLGPVVAARVDSLLLGCTHYPYLARTIGDVMGPEVVLVSSAEETAFEVRGILLEAGLGSRTVSKGNHVWISSGEAAGFMRLGQHFFGPELDHAEHWEPPLQSGLSGARRYG